MISTLNLHLEGQELASQYLCSYVRAHRHHLPFGISKDSNGIFSMFNRKLIFNPGPCSIAIAMLVDPGV